MLTAEGQSCSRRLGRGVDSELTSCTDSVFVLHIGISSTSQGDRPRLRCRRITVDYVAVMHLRLGESLPEIAGRYDLDPAAVYTAMACYFDHRDEIDRSIEADRAFVYVEAFQRENASCLLSPPNHTSSSPRSTG